MNDMIDKIVLPYGLVVCVGQACNLKCVDCGNMAPFADSRYRAYEIDDILISLKKLEEIVARFDCLQIQGGEPFLYNDLPELVNWCVNSNMSRVVLIATNGMIQPSGKIEYLRNSKVKVRISNYSYRSTRIDESERFYKENGIDVYRYNFGAETGEWYKCGRKDDKYDTDEEHAKRRFENCDFNKCLTLEDGRLQYCSRAINAERVMRFSSNSCDYVQLAGVSIDEIREKLGRYISAPQFMQACRYCNGTSERCDAGIQLQ